MTTREEMFAASTAGRTSAPGDQNPYAGKGVLADLWRLGYRTMLVDMLNRSAARQLFLDAQNQAPRP